MGAQPEAIRWTGVLRPRREGSLTPRAERAAVRGALRGDPAALDVLFRAHWPAAYRTAWLIVRDPHAAEDVAQEGFVAAVGALERFDDTRPFGPWLRTIVARRAIDLARARASRREVDGVEVARAGGERAGRRLARRRGARGAGRAAGGPADRRRPAPPPGADAVGDRRGRRRSARNGQLAAAARARQPRGPARPRSWSWRWRWLQR